MRIDDPVTEQVIAASMEVHRCLGPGLLESVYEACLCQELALRGVAFARQVSIPITYKAVVVDASHRLDLVVENRIVVELKAVASLLPLHIAQLVTYLKLADLDIGLLVNFNVAILRHGLRRVTKQSKILLPSSPPPCGKSGF